MWVEKVLGGGTRPVVVCTPSCHLLSQVICVTVSETTDKH